VAAKRSIDASVLAGAQAGHREGLIALRDKLAAAADVAEPAVIAQIAGRLQAVLDRLADLDAQSPPEVSSVDELLARRRTASGASTSSGRRRNLRGG
jgi:hypothetical protein